MNSKRKQNYTIFVARCMNIDPDKYLQLNGTRENILYDMDGLDEEIKKVSQEIYNLKTIFFSAHKKFEENKDDCKKHDLTIAKDKAQIKIHDFIVSIYGAIDKKLLNDSNF